MKLSIVLSTQPTTFSALAYRGELEKNVFQIARLGYDGVELAVRDPQMLDLEHLEKILLENKLEVPAIGTGQAFGEEGLCFTHPDENIRQDAVERIECQIELGARFNSIVILGLIRGRLAEQLSRQLGLQWLLEATKRCAAYAEERDVKLAIEPINRYETNLVNTVVQALDLIERVGSDHLGLLLDTFHMNIEEPSIVESIRVASHKIYHVHVADSNRWYPGGGHLDFLKIVNALDEVNYDGYLSAEILPFPDVDSCARKTITNLQKNMRLAQIK